MPTWAERMEVMGTAEEDLDNGGFAIKHEGANITVHVAEGGEWTAFLLPDSQPASSFLADWDSPLNIIFHVTVSKLSQLCPCAILGDRMPAKRC